MRGRYIFDLCLGSLRRELEEDDVDDCHCCRASLNRSGLALKYESSFEVFENKREFG